MGRKHFFCNSWGAPPTGGVRRGLAPGARRLSLAPGPSGTAQPHLPAGPARRSEADNARLDQQRPSLDSLKVAGGEVLDAVRGTACGGFGELVPGAGVLVNAELTEHRECGPAAGVYRALRDSGSDAAGDDGKAV